MILSVLLYCTVMHFTALVYTLYKVNIHFTVAWAYCTCLYKIYVTLLYYFTVIVLMCLDHLDHTPGPSFGTEASASPGISCFSCTRILYPLYCTRIYIHKYSKLSTVKYICFIVNWTHKAVGTASIPRLSPHSTGIIYTLYGTLLYFFIVYVLYCNCVYKNPLFQLLRALPALL